MLKSENDLRIFVDTNVFINAMLGDATSIFFFAVVAQKYRLVLSTSIIQELFEVVHRKFPYREEEARKFLDLLPFELVYTPSFDRTQFLSQAIPAIADPHDVHVLVSCWLSECDLLISEDKHFHSRKIKERLCVMKVGDFLKVYQGIEKEKGSIG